MEIATSLVYYCLNNNLYQVKEKVNILSKLTKILNLGAIII